MLIKNINSARFFVLLNLIILSVLAHEILIDQLSSQKYTNYGQIKTINSPGNPEQIKGISLFGWIRINSSSASGDIFTFCMETCFYIDDDNEKKGDILFSLQFITWTDQRLRFSMTKKQEEKYASFMTLSSSELDSWIFVYLGHSFVRSRQSYYKYIPSISKRVFIDEISFPEQNSATQYQLFTGSNQLLSRQYFMGEIQRLTVQFGEEAYIENNFTHLHTVHPDLIAQATCSFFFSECAYTGYALNVCETVSQHPMKAIKSVMFKNAEQDYICFGGKKIIVKKSIVCITEQNWVSLQQEKVISIESLFSPECQNE